MDKDVKKREAPAPEDRIASAIGALVARKGVLLVDEENRENEGNPVFGAEKMRVPQMALTIRECSGVFVFA